MPNPFWSAFELLVAVSMIGRGIYGVRNQLRNRRDAKEDARREAAYAEARQAQLQREAALPPGGPVDLAKRPPAS